MDAPHLNPLTGLRSRSTVLRVADGKFGRVDAALISGQSMDDILARKDVGGAACIMDVVVSVSKA